MSELTVDEFVTELLMDLEERLEGGFSPNEEAGLRDLLGKAIRRLEEADRDSD